MLQIHFYHPWTTYDQLLEPSRELWTVRQSLRFANVLIQVLDHRFMLEPHRLRQWSESPPVSLCQIQLASLDQKFDTVLWKCNMLKCGALHSLINMNLDTYQVSFCTCKMKCGAAVKAGCGHVGIWMVVVVPVCMAPNCKYLWETNCQLITSWGPPSRQWKLSRVNSWYLAVCSRPDAVDLPSSGSSALRGQTDGSWKSSPTPEGLI